MTSFLVVTPIMYAIPFISAFIHWITIWMALKMLFHPKEPIHFLGLKIQGVFPKKQKQIAENISKLVGKELLSFEEIEQKITNPANLEGIYPEIEKYVDEFLKVRIKETMPMIAMFIGDKTIGQLKEALMTELKNMLPQLLKNYVGNLKSQLDLEKIVYEKIAAFSGEKLEAMLNQILTKEFRFIEIIGTILGFMIGLLQIFLNMIQ
ncbi:DUF445 domain-containing protein [Polluticaenibacter yanchengensis]|uniref:DUF445 family protein n=1 Tax=Polluticaenibacter yanchengensis TaxID=3014562 RepID=A0ABT4UGH5_9BACT|nr:DUF445 family protein [Chitinophagaceae bacterium LY-5]